jgi:phosphonate transport system permease protein
MDPGKLSYTRITSLFIGIALICLSFADFEISAIDPMSEMSRLWVGLIRPDFAATERLGLSLLYTVAFAFLGVSLGAVSGFLLALTFHLRVIRIFCALLRAVHELFWAILILQIFGLSPLTGLLAIGLPYTGTFAKVYAEILEEADPSAWHALRRGSAVISNFFYARLPDVLPHLKTYTYYRLECGLRSSAVLGFVGLPTLGFHLESAFRQGHYSEAAALLILFYVVIASVKLWMPVRLIPIYLCVAPFVLPGGTTFMWENVVRFFTHDIIPHPLRTEGLSNTGISNFWQWLSDLSLNQALPGAVNTIILTQIALVATGIVAIIAYPFISHAFMGRLPRLGGHIFLVVLRSTPEYVIAYVLLHIWGPSMLPAVVALALHNGGIIGHLIGQQSNSLALRPDAPRGIDLYAYDITPRLYGSFLAFLFYRWEIIMRETAILGILGVHTLGFYVDSAMAELRIDRALFLILATALLNIAIDSFSRRARARLRLTSEITTGPRPGLQGR